MQVLLTLRRLMARILSMLCAQVIKESRKRLVLLQHNHWFKLLITKELVHLHRSYYH